MPVESVFNDGRNAIVASEARLRDAASRIARMSVDLSARDDEGTVSASAQRHDGDGLVEDLVALRLYRHEIGAAAKVVETADEILGTLLDVRA